MADSKLRKSPSTYGKNVPFTPSNVMRAVREVEDGKWWECGGLGYWLYVPESKRNQIRQNFAQVIDQKKQFILYWMKKDPLATWRRLITALECLEETKLADSIRSNAEFLTETSLTPHTLHHVLSTVRRFWGVGELLGRLGVPLSVRDQIRGSSSHSTEEEKRVAGVEYYLETMPGVSWSRIAGVLWYLEEHTALDAVRQYLPHKHDPSLNLPNLTSALVTLPDTEWRVFGMLINVPESKLKVIQSQLSANCERKVVVCSVYLTEHPMPTWDHVSDVIFRLRLGQYHHSVLHRLQSMFPKATVPVSTAIPPPHSTHAPTSAPTSVPTSAPTSAPIYMQRQGQSQTSCATATCAPRSQPSAQLGITSSHTCGPETSFPSASALSGTPANVKGCKCHFGGRQCQGFEGSGRRGPVLLSQHHLIPQTAGSGSDGKTTAEDTHHQLGIDDLFTVNSELHPVAHEWKNIGLALRLQPHVLSIIEKNRIDVQSRLLDVMTEWLNKTYNTARFGEPSWQLLVAAVAHPAGGNNPALAQHIARKYNFSV